ncbi:UBX domain-containing protein 7-like [Asterias amurensis]|uniref:UBX domain-containing protein 7-like n=1 Tax=Asterias amurensis TaxID=7602 RepID=UPI003AB5050A
MASRGKSKSSSAMEGLAKQFSAITGATEEVGLRLLEVCNGNLEMAIGMQLEGATAGSGASTAGVATAGASTAGPSGVSAAPEIPPDDNVRAPIPQKREILVQDVPTFGPRPRRRGGQVSIFDKFRDFQAETRHQEEMIRNHGNLVPQSAKVRTLEDLFRPPVDLMHKGTFNTAMETGQNQGRWLIVNVQDVQEFNCQKLNRDVWSDATVKSIINESFVLWQVYHDSDEGRRYMQFYKVEEFPHVALLDPRTGELLVSWSKLDSTSFCDLVMEFLSNHPCFDKETPASPPAKKARMTKTILDASEDSQLEAAIAASLAESTSDAHKDRVPSSKDTPATIASKKIHETISLSDDDDLDDEDDYDEIVDVEINSNHDSDSDCVIESIKPNLLKNHPLVANSNSSSTTHRTDSKSNERTIQSAVNGTSTADEAVRTKSMSHSEEDAPQGKKTVVTETDSNDGVAKETNSSPVVLKNGEDIDVHSMAKLMLRFPDGKKKQLSLQEDTPLLTLVTLVGKEGFSNERFEMVTNFPRRKLSYLDFDKTLKEAGLSPQETIFIQER